MYGILISAFNSILGTLLRQVIFKFVFFGAVYAAVMLLVPYLSSLLPSTMNLSSALAGIPASMWYFLDLLAFSQGVPLIVAAYATRFLVRRMPVIG